MAINVVIMLIEQNGKKDINVFYSMCLLKVIGEQKTFIMSYIVNRRL